MHVDVETSGGPSRPVGPRCGYEGRRCDERENGNLGGSKSASWSAVRAQEDMVHGDVETSEGFESASWSAVRENFGGVCCVCVSVWSVPTWELDSRGHGCGLVGVWIVVLPTWELDSRDHGYEKKKEKKKKKKRKRKGRRRKAKEGEELDRGDGAGRWGVAWYAWLRWERRSELGSGCFGSDAVCVSGWECCDQKAFRSAVCSSIRPRFLLSC